MKIEASPLSQLENRNLSRDYRAELRCQLSRELEDKGDYEAARQIMGELWRRIGERPHVEELEQSAAGEVLLRAGVLTGWIGSKDQIKAQEIAKNLITESITVFQSLNYGKKVAEAQIELAYCYWREGAYDEARDILREVVSRLSTDGELKAKAVLRSAIVEWSALRYKESLRILMEAAPLFERIKNHTIKGGYHNALAGVLEELGALEGRRDYLDRAFIEYTAAGFHFEQAKHKNYRANVENNLGYLFFKIHSFKKAHEHLERARHLLGNLKNRGAVAQVDETRARVFLAEGRYAEAERAARSAVSWLEKGGQQGILAESLITHGRALARLGYHSQAYATLKRAVEAAQQSGATDRAGEAALTLIEELGEHLTLQKTQDTSSASGLADVRQYERELIKQALIKTDGSITQAARLLGTSHQQLSFIIETRQKELLALRTPIKRRRKRT
jgi:tetratricopeptide (TPR) repeat protein